MDSSAATSAGLIGLGPNNDLRDKTLNRLRMRSKRGLQPWQRRARFYGLRHRFETKPSLLCKKTDVCLGSDQSLRLHASVLEDLADAEEALTHIVEPDETLGWGLRHQHRLPLTKIEGAIGGEPNRWTMAEG